ncbi:hypothetical protein ACSX1A_03840 [Pontibacter sp. MBLB2868]|uniref:hypothetical protein n=1 Tax=Pontibacter sp. MBLB2868 TaxID=3451555 RepID=UPI003F752EED
MEDINAADWDEERYLYLNTYFRVKIQGLMDGDPYLKELVRQERGLELQDLIDRMADRDKVLWDEFILLDRIKLHRDMHNHLEGRGTPYKPGYGFGSSTSGEEDEQQPW